MDEATDNIMPVSLEDKISYYHLAVFLVTLPFDRFYSELVFISFLVHTLIHLNRKKIKAAFTRPNLVVSSVFFVALVGMAYSQDRAQGFKDLERQLGILLFPFAFGACGLDFRKYKMSLLMAFAFTCVVTILYLYADAIRIILYNRLPLSYLFSHFFINHNFSSPIGLHATYMAMYTLLSAATLFYIFLRESRRNLRIIYFLCVLVLLAGLLQLASKSVLISAIVIAPCFPFYMLKGVKRWRLLTGIAVVSLIGGFVIANVSSLRERYVGELRGDLTQASTDNEILEPRVVRWDYTLQLIQKSPLIGYGSGSEKRLLQDTYFQNKLYNSFLHELNAHNQFLSILLKTGIWGLLFFLWTLFAGFLASYRNKDVLFTSFMIIISVVSFSENLLDVNKGIFFYAFFLSLFVQSGKPFVQLSRYEEKQDSVPNPEPLNKAVHATTIRSNNYL